MTVPELLAVVALIIVGFALPAIGESVRKATRRDGKDISDEEFLAELEDTKRD